MRLRNIPGANEAVAASPYCIQNAAEHRGLRKNSVVTGHLMYSRMTTRSTLKSAWEKADF